MKEGRVEGRKEGREEKKRKRGISRQCALP